jgi:DNA-binding NarL/FixJ family response regulator
MVEEKNRCLTPRELEILQFTAKGLEQKQIAEILGISFATVVSHKKKLFKKLGVHNVAEAIYEAFQMGLLKVQK